MITIAKKTSKSKKAPSKSKKTSKPKSENQTKPKKESKSKKIEHVLIPKHTKLNDKQKKDMLEKYNISLEQLPRIFIDDPAIADLDLTTDDVIRIDRSSPTAGIAYFYRRVVK